MRKDQRVQKTTAFSSFDFNPSFSSPRRSENNAKWKAPLNLFSLFTVSLKTMFYSNPGEGLTVAAT